MRLQLYSALSHHDWTTTVYTKRSLVFCKKSERSTKNKVQKLTHFYRCSNQGFIVLPLFKRNTFSWFNLRRRKGKQGCDPLFGFCFLPNCQSRVCCPAGYMTLSVSSHIIMEITSKKGMTWKVYYQVLTNKLQLRYESSTLILYKELSSSIFQSCLSVRHAWHPSKSPLFAIYKGMNVLYWPSIINFQLLPPHSVLNWPSTQLFHLVTHSWANWI